ncbi:MAG TPA: hypothetical protein VM427_08410 [Patescibacteria group bacterium]|nr:hypothetical protein [Patescibacteria group bacterium]
MIRGRGSPSTTRGKGRLRHLRPLFVPVAASILAMAGVIAPARAPAVAAAGDGLTLSSSATYTIVPARQVVRVVIDLTARNDKPNLTSGEAITRYFYDGARLAIQSEAKNIRATSGGQRVSTSFKPDDGFAVLDVRFRASIFFKQSTTTRITYDLPGGAPRSASAIRVGTAFATFVAWAFGDSGSVRIIVPAGFEAATSGSGVTRATSAGATILRSAAIADPADWYVVVNADREGALTRERIDLAGGEHVVIRGWPEDDDWRTQVRDLLTTGLPELVDQTGLDWPVAGDLTVFEVHTPLLEGYAGVFIVNEDRIEISEDLDDLTILHEASHAWFNGELFQGRWINEGFADAFAARALDGVGIGGWEPASVAPTDAAAVRLMTWEHPGRITDNETDAREQYGYDASWTVIRSLLGEIGDESMRAVLAAAEAHRIPYVGSGSPESVTGPADWRRFLDLLQEVGRSRTADAVFRRWVVTDAQIDILDKRTAARARWADLVTAGGDWLAPFAVRDLLTRWDYAGATTRIEQASAILAQRDEIARLARSLGLEPPTLLRAAYESASRSLDGARTIAMAELADLRALGAAVAARDAPRDPLISLGLIGTTPDADLAAARAAFSAGAPDTTARAAAVVALILGASEIGRARLIAAIAGLLVVLVILVVTLLALRRRSRARRPAAGSPYATLADQSGGPTDGRPGGPIGPVPDLAADPIGPSPADRSDAS